MANLESPSKPSGGRKLQKRNPNLHRLPSSHIPSRLSLGADAQDDVTAPSRGRNAPAQYMNQSIFSMIAAAGSRTDFNARFDESSDSEEEIAEEEATHVEVEAHPATSVDKATLAQEVMTRDEPSSVEKKSKRLSGKRLVQSLPRPSARAFKPKGKESV
ncbi:Sterol 3-beta-glucosyltransferase, partial [Exophiala xenobiotica]